MAWSCTKIIYHLKWCITRYDWWRWWRWWWYWYTVRRTHIAHMRVARACADTGFVSLKAILLLHIASWAPFVAVRYFSAQYFRSGTCATEYVTTMEWWFDVATARFLTLRKIPCRNCHGTGLRYLNLVPRTNADTFEHIYFVRGPASWQSWKRFTLPGCECELVRRIGACDT